MPTFKANLSVESLDSLLLDIQRYRQKLDRLEDNLPGILADEVSARMDASLSSIINTDGADGNNDADTETSKSSKHGEAILTGTQAAFLEFGTGIVGAGSPHPLSAQEAWQYNVGSKIFVFPDGSPGWVWGHGKDIHFTHGIAAQKIAYNAAQSVRKDVAEIAKKELTNG